MTLVNLIDIKDFLETFYKDCYTTSEGSINFKDISTAELFLKEFKPQGFTANFTLSGSSVIFDIITPINNAYIVSWFDINKERKTVVKTSELGSVSFDIEGLNPANALKEITNELSNFPANSYFKDDNCSYGGGPEWAVYIDNEVVESDNEVITRLKNESRLKRSELKKYKEAIDFIGSFDNQ